MHERLQRTITEIVTAHIRDGRESAVQVAAYHHGRLIVDVWAARPGVTITGDTLIPIFSTGKGLANTAIHRLVERGALRWDEPIATWWPEFAAAGKAAITLRQALDHTAGMAMMPEHNAMADCADWDGMCRWLAAAKPAHTPGTARHYHAITFSWLLGETARRADGRPFAQIVREEIAEPLGLTSPIFGTEAGMVVLDVEPGPPAPPPVAPAPVPTPNPIAERAIPHWVKPLEDFINREDIRRACIPSSNGVMNARDIARHYAALIGSGVDGVRLLSDATVAAATEERRLPGETRAPWGLGYGLKGPEGQAGMVFGHGGYGGSSGLADRSRGLALGLTKTRMSGAAIVTEVTQAIHAELDA